MNKRLAVLSIALLLAGCASERVVLLPSADGRPGAVVVRGSAGELLLDTPYAASVRRLGSTSPYQANAEEVAERYGATLAARPPRPRSFVLYFEPGGNVLTPESARELPAIQKEIAERAASEVMVIGHTDRVGSLAANDGLSLQRAASVRDQLIAAGIAADKLEAVGRGEREPLVATDDEVAEARNRRVEISVR